MNKTLLESSPRQIETAPKSTELPESFPKGRVCSRPGCTQPLSIWNQGPRCNPCLFDDELNLRVDLEELMRQP